MALQANRKSLITWAYSSLLKMNFFLIQVTHLFAAALLGLFDFTIPEISFPATS